MSDSESITSQGTPNRLSGTPNDWQGERRLGEACRYMLNNQIACDVTFLVGENEVKITAHRFMLICRSTVFQAMFCGGLAPIAEDIKIPDIEPDIFRTFLTFLYTDGAVVTGENVLPLLYSAKKYCVNTLVRHCLTFLNNGRSTDNICSIMEQAHLYDEEEFLRKSVDYILLHAPDVMKSPSFLELCAICLKRIITMDELQADERTVWHTVTKWAERQCDKRDLECTPENLRHVMGDILYLVRFPLLGEVYFTNVVSDSGLLTDKEKVELFKYFYKTAGNTTTFITRNRYATSAISQHIVPPERKPTDRTIQTCMRFTTVCDDGSWYCGGEPDALAFSTSHDIWLHGALVYGSYIGEGVYDITCAVYDPQGTELVQLRTQIKTSEHQLTYVILFENSIHIAKDSKYSLLAKMTNPDGIDTYQGKDGFPSVNVGNVRFTFTKSKFSKNGTDAKMGQIPGLLFSL